MLKTSDMQSAADDLATDLQGVLDGVVSNDEFRARHPIAGQTGPLEELLCHVEHYLGDADIRRRDSVYRSMQNAEMQKLISLLCSGRLNEAAKIHLLGQSD